MSRPIRIVVALVTLYASWMGMMAIHESGHILAALAGGGHVRRVVIPLVGFSRTDVDPNPSPRLEVWGGPVWGSAIPLVTWLFLRNKLPKPLRSALGFFTGLCLVANGTYLGVGWAMTTGDAAQLIHLGTPIWLLIVFGLTATILGLYVWHTLGRLNTILRAEPPLAVTGSGAMEKASPRPPVSRGRPSHLRNIDIRRGITVSFWTWRFTWVFWNRGGRYAGVVRRCGRAGRAAVTEGPARQAGTHHGCCHPQSQRSRRHRQAPFRAYHKGGHICPPFTMCPRP